jgi:uncharacterized protein (DUF169 family)
MNTREKTNLLASLLDLDRVPIAVKFLVNNSDYDNFECDEVKGRMTYCLMVKKTITSGLMMKATIKNINCPGAARALGLMEISDDFKSGGYGRNLKIYKNLLISKKVANEITFCNHNVRGFAVGPLSEFKEDPDVVLMVVTPYKAMRIVQAHTFNNGIHNSFTVSGNQAYCSELTAVPYEKNAINLSLFCSGTRAVGGWDEGEMGVGFPFHFLDNIIEGVIGTLNAVEPNSKKEVISKNIVENNVNSNEIEIRLNENYYRNVYTLKKDE